MTRARESTTIFTDNLNEDSGLKAQAGEWDKKTSTLDYADSKPEDSIKSLISRLLEKESPAPQKDLPVPEKEEPVHKKEASVLEKEEPTVNNIPEIEKGLEEELPKFKKDDDQRFAERDKPQAKEEPSTGLPKLDTQYRYRWAEDVDKMKSEENQRQELQEKERDQEHQKQDESKDKQREKEKDTDRGLELSL
jgi:hypothetical protein